MNRKIHITVLLLVVFAVFSLAVPQEEELPTTGVGFNIGAFGIPDAILDLFIYEHPKIRGNNFAFEVRSFGNQGMSSPFTGLYSFAYNRMTGDGIWRVEQHNRRLDGAGEIVQFSFTATVLLNILPRLPVHPYIGAGIGIEKAVIWSEGVYKDEFGTEIKETFEESYILPVGHIPVGISINILNKAEVRVEGGFKNGFYIGGSACYCF